MCTMGECNELVVVGFKLKRNTTFRINRINFRRKMMFVFHFILSEFPSVNTLEAPLNPS